MISVTDAFAQAVQYHQVGNLGLAEPLYRQILEAIPDHADALHLLGLLLYQTGRSGQAVPLIRRATALSPWVASYYSTLGLAYQALGQMDQSVAAFEQSLQLQPDYADAHSNLGDVLRIMGRVDEAVTHCRQAILSRPDLAQAHGNLGNALLAQHKFDEAVTCLRRALTFNPNLPAAHNSLANALEQQNKTEEAIYSYRQALRLCPTYAAAHGNLGMLLQRHGMFQEAIECYRRNLQLEPNNLTALGGLVHQLQHLCQWDGLEDLSRRVIEAVERSGLDDSSGTVPPFVLLTLPTPTTAQQQLKCARMRVDQIMKSPVVKKYGKRAACFASRPPRESDRITLGYLSSNFRVHPIGYLVVELLEKHDRQRFQVHGYSYGKDDASPIRQRIASACDRFIDLKDATIAESAQRIESDGVDILIDLTGYTEDSRTHILALRPAPIQINYLGFPGTMGANFLDYILVDEVIVPADQQPFFTEKLVHLPGSYQANDSQRSIAAWTPSRQECGLPESGFVFCCFNTNYKITPEMFGVWMELLKAVPGSVLWLLESNRFVPANLRREAEARRVGGERIVFAPPKPLAEHLARHRLADLFVDTFPYNAHTTASDSLWVGCPVLTRMGQTFASRVAASLLRTVGLPELVTQNLDDYRDLALRLARDPGLLAGLRSRLQANRHTSRLFDAERFARSVEQAYAAMWETYTAGGQPCGI